MAKAPQKTEDAPAAGGGKKKLIIILVLVIVLLGGGAAAWFLLFSDGGGGEDEQAATEEQSAVVAPLLYYRLDEPVTATLQPDQPVNHLRVNFVLAARDQAVIDALRLHTPILRNDVLEILGTQDYIALNTPEGKEALREQLQEAITAILVRTGSPAGVEHLFFSEMVMQ